MNLIYIRAAIEQATGQKLPLETILRLLVEEDLITAEKASDPDLIFRGYDQFFSQDYEHLGEPSHG